jgi:hypothetical protein
MGTGCGLVERVGRTRRSLMCGVRVGGIERRRTLLCSCIVLSLLCDADAMQYTVASGMLV